MEENTFDLKESEVHPGAHIAYRYLMSFGVPKLMSYMEPIASAALSGNRLAEVAQETLRRLLQNEKVSDRYLMGLAWFIWEIQNVN